MRLKAWLRSGIVLALCVIVSIGWVSWKSYELRRVQAGLGEAEQDLAAGRPHRARERLIALVGRSRLDPRVLYQLGVCEESLGHGQAALDVWARVPAGSSDAPRARLASGRVAMNLGRYSLAEEFLGPLAQGPGELPDAARQALELILRLQGRKADVWALMVDSWVGSTDPGIVLGRLFILENGSFPLEYVKNTLESGDPDDDRVWLAKANLAAWLGRTDEAGRWLDRCLSKRPEDRAVWRERLLLAMAVGDEATFAEAARRLPVSALIPREQAKARAWLAAHSRDRQIERGELERLVKQTRGLIWAWDRLAEIAMDDHNPALAETYRVERARYNLMGERYRSLIGRDDRSAHAAELARLGEQLGRRLEARGWSLIAGGRASEERLLDESEGLTTLLADSFADLGLGRRVGKPMERPRPSENPIAFVDESRMAGLTFVHENGHAGKRNPPPTEAMCGGVALLDYDGDGRLDLYAAQGGEFPPPGEAVEQGDRLYRNIGEGRFEDATRSSGLAGFPGGYGHGVAVGDYDNDGRPDLLITRWRSYALYHNLGGGRFEDVTARAGLAGQRDWPTSAAFADLDQDGDLDLYVCHYLAYDPGNPRRCAHPESPSKHECNPRDFPSLPDHVFRNDGGHFVDVTAKAGFTDPDGRGLGVVAGHLDDDDHIDLYVANDMSANYLFHNLGDFRFEERGQSAGAAASADGGFKAGMGVAFGDLDGDLRMDLAVTNYFGESTTFFRALGDGYFADQSGPSGLSALTRSLLGFGIVFLDADGDGWLDVLSANGHVLDGRPRFPWTMPLQILRGSPGGVLRDVSETAGAPFSERHLGRGLAVGDIDDDGRPDAVVLCQNEPLVLLRNTTPRSGRAISLLLEGTGMSNRDAVGARVSVTAAARRWVGQRHGGGSYQSASDPRLVFGLGEAAQADLIEVRWPSGRVDHHAGLAADHRYRLREGDAKPTDLGPFHPREGK